MSWAAVVVGGTALISTGIQAAQARKQRKMAENIKPVNPGANQALIDNKNLLERRYGNYEMPGLATARGQVEQAGATAFNNAVQGATSSGDVLDAATRIAYGTQRSMSDLNIRNVMAKEQALAQYLDANAAAGHDQTSWDRQTYLTDRQDRANLRNASDVNMNNAIQGGLGAVGQAGAMYFANRGVTQGNQNIDTVLPGASVGYNAGYTQTPQYLGVRRRFQNVTAPTILPY